MDIEELTNRICFKEVFDLFEIQSKLEKTDKNYWSIFTAFFKTNFNAKFVETKIQFEKFENELYLNSFFKTYFKNFDFSRYNKTEKHVAPFDIALNKFVKKNFENLHENMSDFKQLLKIVDIPEGYFKVYEDFYFEKFFCPKNKIKNCSYEEWIEFWCNILKYQKLPRNIFLRYLPNFEDKNLKEALNTSTKYRYYFEILESMPMWYKKLKFFN